MTELTEADIAHGFRALRLYLGVRQHVEGNPGYGRPFHGNPVEDDYASILRMAHEMGHINDFRRPLLTRAELYPWSEDMIWAGKKIVWERMKGQAAINVTKSCLLLRILFDAKMPLPYPPPVVFSAPQYNLVERYYPEYG